MADDEEEGLMMVMMVVVEEEDEGWHQDVMETEMQRYLVRELQYHLCHSQQQHPETVLCLAVWED